jgi:DNA-binding transcriptional ArsR family regulator
MAVQRAELIEARNALATFPWSNLFLEPYSAVQYFTFVTSTVDHDRATGAFYGGAGGAWYPCCIRNMMRMTAYSLRHGRLQGAPGLTVGQGEKALPSHPKHHIVIHMANCSVELNSVFHALADPTRRAVIERLGHGPATVSELAEPFGMALPSFMKHVGVLERTGLIRSSKFGRIRTCALQRQNLAAAERWFDEQRALWAGRYENLDKLLDKLKGVDNET